MASVTSSSTSERCKFAEVFCQQQRLSISQWQAKCRELEVKVQKEKEDVGEAWGKVAGLEQMVVHYANQVAKINSVISDLQQEKQSVQVENERLQSELIVASEKTEDSLKKQGDHANTVSSLEKTVNATRNKNFQLEVKLILEENNVKQLQSSNLELHRVAEKLKLVDKDNLTKIEDLNAQLEQRNKEALEQTSVEEALRQEICELKETIESFKNRNVEMSNNARQFQTEIAKLQKEVKVETLKVARFQENEEMLLDKVAQLEQQVTYHLNEHKRFTEQITDLEYAKQKLETQVEQQNREILQLKINEKTAKKVDKLEKCCQTENTELANCKEHKAQIRDMLETNLKLMREVEQLKERGKQQAGKILKMNKMRQQRKENIDTLEALFQQQIKETMELKQMQKAQTENLQIKINCLETKLAKEKQVSAGMNREILVETKARVDIEKRLKKFKALVEQVNRKLEKKLEKVQPNCAKEMMATRRSSEMSDPENEYRLQQRLGRNMDRVTTVFEALLRKKCNTSKSKKPVFEMCEVMETSLSVEELNERSSETPLLVKRARESTE